MHLLTAEELEKRKQIQINQRKVKVSLWLDSYTIDELQREADQNQISLNVLVNQALKRYSDWDRYETRICDLRN